LKTKKQFREAWLVSHRINLMLLDAIGENALATSYAPRTRNIRRIFVHLHNQRLNWLGAMVKNPPQIERLKSRDPHDIPALKAALDNSANAIADLLEGIAKQRKPLNGFHRSPTTLLAFMVAHEAHHRGQVVLALRLAAKPLPRELTAALWDWDHV
jgi:uncharacterized damage-inducible protein DinB